MDSFLKRITPLILLLMAGLAFFEHWLPGANRIAAMVGADGVLRFVIGVLCIYVMLLVLERQSLDARFTRVLETFKQFYAARAGAAAGEEQADEKMEQAKKQALRSCWRHSSPMIRRCGRPRWRTCAALPARTWGRMPQRGGSTSGSPGKRIRRKPRAGAGLPSRWLAGCPMGVIIR
jgi:hypothetical protein